MRLHALLMGFLLVTAGCLGSDDDAGDTPDEPDDPDPTGGPDAPDSPNGTAEPATQRNANAFQGSYTGVNAVAASTTVTGDGNTFSFEVPEGSIELAINFTTEGGELRLHIADPECEPTLEDSGCEEIYATSGGSATATIDAPLAGTWDARIFSEDPVANGVTFTVEVVTTTVV